MVQGIVMCSPISCSWGKHNKKISLSEIYKAAKHVSTSKVRCHKDIILNLEEVNNQRFI